uniref:Uncharacterized protein n=1 Tax=Schistocephalus solidus TaxID=70667 RepID=A0A0X3PGA0_SCHSO
MLFNLGYHVCYYEVSGLIYGLGLTIRRLILAGQDQLFNSFYWIPELLHFDMKMFKILIKFTEIENVIYFQCNLTMQYKVTRSHYKYGSMQQELFVLINLVTAYKLQPIFA